MSIREAWKETIINCKNVKYTDFIRCVHVTIDSSAFVGNPSLDVVESSFQLRPHRDFGAVGVGALLEASGGPISGAEVRQLLGRRGSDAADCGSRSRLKPAGRVCPRDQSSPPPPKTVATPTQPAQTKSAT